MVTQGYDPVIAGISAWLDETDRLGARRAGWVGGSNAGNRAFQRTQAGGRGDSGGSATTAGAVTVGGGRKKMCQATKLFCGPPAKVTVSSAKGMFAYDGSDKWRLEFDAIFDIVPGFDISGYVLLQRLTDAIHPHLRLGVRALLCRVSCSCDPS